MLIVLVSVRNYGIYIANYMDGDTPIYIANYGESEVDLNGEYVALKPVGINLKDNNIILVTRKEED